MCPNREFALKYAILILAGLCKLVAVEVEFKLILLFTGYRQANASRSDSDWIRMDSEPSSFLTKMFPALCHEYL